MDQRRVVVDETRIEDVRWQGRRQPGSRFDSHARTRFVTEPEPPPVQPLLDLGKLFDDVTVRARLHRLGDVFRKLPHTPDTKPGGYKSCMPEHVREVFKDLPGEPMKLPVAAGDHAAAMQVLDSLIQRTPDERMIMWGVACKLSARGMAPHLRCSDKTVRERVLALLRRLAEDWNGRGWRPEQADIDIAQELINRKHY